MPENICHNFTKRSCNTFILARLFVDSVSFSGFLFIKKLPLHRSGSFLFHIGTTTVTIFIPSKLRFLLCRIFTYLFFLYFLNNVIVATPSELKPVPNTPANPVTSPVLGFLLSVVVFVTACCC